MRRAFASTTASSALRLGGAPSPVRPIAPPRSAATPCAGFAEELQRVDEELQPHAAQFARKRWFQETLAPLLERHTGGELRTFGSCENGFWVKGSDIDTCLVIPNCAQRPSLLTKLRLVKALVERDQIGTVQVVRNARVPVAKIRDQQNEELGDLCVNNISAIENSALVGVFARLDSRVLPLGRLIKNWASCRRINERSQGTLSTYTLILQLFHFLQTRTVPVLPLFTDIMLEEGAVGPAVESLSKEQWAEAQVQLRPLPFATDVRDICAERFAGQGRNLETLPDLLYDFFQVYGGARFGGGNEGQTVDIYDGGLAANDLGVLVMRCPLTWRNVNPMTVSVWQAIHAEFSRAASMLQAGKTWAEICEPAAGPLLGDRAGRQ